VVGVSVNLQTPSATSTGGFANIQRFFGSTAATDTLVGRNIANTWHVTSNNAGDINGPGVVDFVGFENLTGGTNNDAFVLSDGVGVSGAINGAAGAGDSLSYAAYTTPVSVNLATGAATNVTGGVSGIESFVGGAASDTLTGANAANTWNVTASNAGNINAATTFASFENLTGGTLADTFKLSPGVGVSGAINGGVGTNTLDYSLYVTPVVLNVAGTAATNVGGGFTNVTNFIGGSATDTIGGNNVANTWNVTGVNAGNLNGSSTFSSFETLSGGTNTDAFVFSAGASVAGTLFGSGGNDTLDFSALGTAVTVNLAGGTSTNTGGVNGIETVLGGSGNDILLGDGNANRLEGNGGADVIVGNGGADTGLGGNGRDLLIGGAGADNLDGGAGEDILIGGTTSWDANIANLTNIIGRWAGAGLYAARITDLKTNAPTLLPLTTVFNDGGAVDTLTGGAADLDWFIAEAVDSTPDFNTPAGETKDIV
jgi:hypothetical protein